MKTYKILVLGASGSGKTFFLASMFKRLTIQNNVYAWPFLVSRNRRFDYQTVVAPNFMVKAKIADLLADKVGGDLTDEPIYINLQNSKVGSIGLIYRVIVATDEGEVFRDAFGRPILWIEGVAVKGLIQKGVAFREVLDEAHRLVQPFYKEYWESNEIWSAKSSSPFMIEDLGLKTIQEKNFGYKVKRALIMTAAASAAAMILISIWPGDTRPSLDRECSANPARLVASASNEITVRAFSQRSPAIPGASVHIEADAGTFESTGKRTVDGLTDSDGKFSGSWRPSEPGARRHVMSVQVTKEGYNQGTDCQIELRETQ